MRTIILMITLISLAFGITACSGPNGSMNNEDAGTITGGVLGGLVGSRFGGGSGQLFAIGAGTLAGAMIGNSMGRNMDDQDRARMSQSFENNPNGTPAYWRNENTGAAYTVTPVKNVTYKKNRYCREYQTTAVVAGKTQQIYGTACRQPDGSWKIVK